MARPLCAPPLPHTHVVVVELIWVALELVADAEPLPDEGVDVVVVHVVVAALLVGGAHKGARRSGRVEVLERCQRRAAPSGTQRLTKSLFMPLPLYTRKFFEDS